MPGAISATVQQL